MGARGGGLRIPSEHPGVRGWPGFKRFGVHRIEIFLKNFGGVPGVVQPYRNITVVFPLFFRGVSVAFRGSSVALARMGRTVNNSEFTVK